MKNAKTLAEAQSIGRVVISDPDHPHYGESGSFTGEMISLFRQLMAEVRLEDCRHGTDGCFVKKGQTSPERRMVRR